MDRAELKELAKSRLKENRWPMTLVALAVTMVTAIASACTGTTYNDAGEAVQNSPTLTVVGVLLTIFVVNVMTVGACKFFRDNIMINQESSLISYPFKHNYIQNVSVMFVRSILVTIGCVLFIVPGVILSMGFAAVPYIATQKPELSLVDTLKLSWNVMNGHKWEYFVLILSFFGWICLDVLTLGIAGVFYIHPYIMQTEANYFDRLLA